MTAGQVLALLCCSSLATCGVQTAAYSTPPRSASGNSARTLAATTGLTSSAATALTSATSNTTAGGAAPFTCNLPVLRTASGSGPARPTTARVGGRPGYDRIVFEYAGTALPSLTVTPVMPPFARDSSGKPMTVAGKVFLRIVFRGVPGIVSGYSGPTTLKAGLPVLTDLELSGDFEGVQGWVAGLSGQACIRVFTVNSPPRFVLDLVASSSPGLPMAGQRPSAARP